MREIRGKKALVTGAASGIGRAVALRLADEGAELSLVDIDEEGLAEVVDACRGRGVQAAGHVCDVGRPQEVSATLDAVRQAWSNVDILVNNAGITYYGRTHRMSGEHWERLLRINLHAPIQFTRELLPEMLQQPESHIVNICSVLGLVGMPKVNAYCVSKFALVGFSESLRAEYGRDGLGVTALCPGFVDTRLFKAPPGGGIAPGEVASRLAANDSRESGRRGSQSHSSRSRAGGDGTLGARALRAQTVRTGCDRSAHSPGKRAARAAKTRPADLGRIARLRRATDAAFQRPGREADRPPRRQAA